MTNSATNESFKSADGLDIHAGSWHPETPPRAVVVIVHGFNSHSGHYAWVVDRFVDQGFAVYALDLRGRGKSEGDRYFVHNVTEYTSDVDALVKIAKAKEPGVPVFVLGHSAGGVISCVYALEHQTEFAGLICESFAFEVPASHFVLTVLKGLSHIAPRAHVLRLPNEGFSRDPAVVASMNDDPLISGEVQPSQTVAALVRANERLEREFERITLPLFILHGTADQVTKPSGSQFFFDHAGSKDKSLRLYEGHVHDLLRDVGKEEVLTDIESWIDARVAA